MSNDLGNVERGAAIGRVEAFSDGVIAIIVTIMVLELHAPAADGWAPLLALWPVALAYLLSYGYVAIYWVNHHRLFSHAKVVSNGLLWSNMALLFTLSLVPFSTAYLGEHHFSREAVWLYLLTMVLPSVSYVVLQKAIRRTGHRDLAAMRYHAAATRKGVLAMLVYLLGVPLTLVSPWLGVACAALVAALWFLPQSGIDRLFLACGARPV
jgi:uncharacterized membrane protein